MRGTLGLAVAIVLAAGGPALAQMTGGGLGGGGMGGGRGGGGRGSHNTAPAPTQTPHRDSTPAKDPGDKPESQVEIAGVVKDIDRSGGRMTIAYDPVEELNWPRGTMPFPVADTKLLDAVGVGQRVRFKVDSHEIYEIRPEAQQPAP